MIRDDRTRVYLPHRFNQTVGPEKLNEYRSWLLERDIKYSIFIESVFGLDVPAAIILNNEDALAFKLAFEL